MTHSDGTLTVVMPTYNHAAYIRTALESVIAQTRRPDRLVIIDDASTDNTAAIVADYAGRHPWIAVRTNSQNRGVVTNLNAGLATTMTEYITFLASDDFVMPTLYAKTSALLKTYPQAGLCAVLTRWVDERGQPVRQPRPATLGKAARYLPPAEIAKALSRHGSVFGGNGTIYRTAPLKQAGGFDTDLGSFCDGYLIQLLSLRYGACYIPEVLAAWRRLEQSYAALSQADPQTCRVTMNTIARRLAGADGTAFPVAYQGRLERRARFTFAAAAVRAKEADREALREALGPSRRWLYPILDATHRLFGRGVPSLVLMVVLRPWDLIPAVARWLFAWSAGAEISPRGT